MSDSSRIPDNEPREEVRRIGKYEIIRQLGAGGMGTVYLATDSELKRTVALKVLPLDRAKNPTLVRRFKSEGQAAALLQHKNIVSVFEAGEASGHLFLALEFVDGIDLLEWVNRRGPIPIKRSVEIMRQAAAALQHAYERNIVHRDIKPSNLMISREGTVKLTDMGLARSIDDTLDTTITRDGTTVGTVDYMAPEQASNSKAADIRSDLYSLGCTWYHLITGSPPYPMGSVTNKISAHISAQLPDPRTLNPKVPEALIAVIHRLMAKKKEQRYQTPAELIADLNSSVLQTEQAGPDLLAMFADDIDLKESDDGVSILTGDGPSSTDFTVHSQQPQQRKSATPSVLKTNAPAREKLSRIQATRCEIPVAKSTSDPRRPLVRMAVDAEGQAINKRPVPWGLIIFAVILIAITLVVRVLLQEYATHEISTDSDWSPYSTSPNASAPEPIDPGADKANAAPTE